MCFLMDYLDLRYKEANYVEAIRDGEIIRIPESVALEEDLFILRKLGGAPQQTSVAAPMPALKRDNAAKGSVMSDWKAGRFGVKKNNVIADLAPHFHWEIAKARKQRNLTRHKLAQMIGAQEHEVKLLELGELPSDDFVLISRIEQLFGINLRNYAAASASVNLADLQKKNEQKKKDTSVPSVSNDGMAGNDIEILDE